MYNLPILIKRLCNVYTSSESNTGKHNFILFVIFIKKWKLVETLNQMKNTII